MTSCSLTYGDGSQNMADAAVVDDEFDVESADPMGSAAAASPETGPPGPKQSGPVAERDVPAQAPAAPTKPSHPAFLVEMAREYGLSDRQIAQADADELTDFVRRQRQRESAAASAFARPAAAAPAPPAREPEPEPEDDLKDFGIERDKWDADTVKVFEAFAKSNKALRQRLDAHETERKNQTAQTAYDALDEFFAGLADDRFGSGDRFTLDPQSAEVKRRLALVRAAGIDLQNPPAPRQIARMLKAAHADLYPAATEPAPAKDAGAYGGNGHAANGAANGNGHAKAERPRGPDGRFLSDAELAEREREEAARGRWAAGGLAAPAERRGAQPKGRESANNVVREKLASLGLPTDSAVLSRDDAEAEDTLLD